MNRFSLRRYMWQAIFGLFLVAMSALVYFVHYLIFRDAHHIFIYMFGDIAFVFIEVLLVTFVIHGLLNYREKKAMMNKLNMVIGAFFSEVGTQLISKLSDFDRSVGKVRESLKFKTDFTQKEFNSLIQNMESYSYEIDAKGSNLKELKGFLVSKRSFLLGLLENPNLLEHESFTELLWAVFHLTEELEQRKDVNSLPDSDYDHLSGDIARAYSKLTVQWLNYMNHLRKVYPYLYSLAIRTNPFDKNATPEVV